MTLRLLHLADLHLDTAFGGQAATRDRLAKATREAFAAGVDLALSESLDAVLVAGDGFDDERLDFSTERWLARQVERLCAGGVHLLWIAGNHDPGGPGKRLAGLGLGTSARSAELGYADRVHVIREAGPVAVELHGSDGQLIGIIAAAGHPTSNETDNLAARFPRFPNAAVPLVGLLHTQVHAAAGSAEHAAYAPSTEADLAATGYDYWALGHVHQRGRPFATVPAWYSGNLVGRNPKETGPKGGLLVEVEAGAPPRLTFIELAPTRWEQVEVPGLEACTTASSIADALLGAAQSAQSNATATELLLRLVPTGPCPAAALLSNPSARETLELELRATTGLLEVQVRPRGLVAPRSLDELRSHPSALASALDLAVKWESDPSAAEPFLPARLAGLPPTPGPEREKYMHRLTTGLAELLLQRAIPAATREPRG